MGAGLASSVTMSDAYGATKPNEYADVDVEEVAAVADEAPPAHGSARRLWTACGLSLVGGMAVVGSGYAGRAGASPLLAAQSAAKSCLSTDTAVIYKYTLASSSPLADGLWADDLFGCTYRDVTDAHGCAELGKTSCMHSLEFGLHFVHNYVTEAGTTSVEAWDEEMIDLHETAYKSDAYDQFMDYSLTFYAPNLTSTVTHLYESNTEVMARKQMNNGELWYSFVVWSPSGKVFELTSTVVDESALPGDVPFWKTESECPQSHLVTTYTRDELDHLYTHTLKAGASRTPIDLPVLMPIRSNIATGDAKQVAAWYDKHMPAISFSTSTASDESDTCVWTTAAISVYTYSDVKHEIRFIENPKALTKTHTVSDFVDYIESVNRNYTSVYDVTSATTETGSSGGWSSWYDRHLGIMLETCALDDYMTVFAESGVSFHPHGQNGTTTINTGTPKDHMWTEGTSGYGLEMQGSFDHSYSDCFEVFNWCSWDTSPAPAAAQCF